MEERNCLILTQYRNDSDYNDFIGKYYHFPATDKKNYLNQFSSLPIEVVYYEPDKKGDGVFYGYGRITKRPFIDKKTPDHYFVEISDFKPFSKPVSFKNSEGEILEKLYNSEFYNYNNAVRKINPEFLDELCLDGGIVLNFKADAHLVEVLGEQLIESEKVGILELIKNSLDSGASYCNVRIEKIKSIPKTDEKENRFNQFEGPVIVIEDDGVGMTREVIENGWLRPATTLKTNLKEQLKKEKLKALETGKLSNYESLLAQLKSQYKGRIPLGEKGVGRFATHRLGKHLLIITKTADIDYELVLKINWDDFNQSSPNTLTDLSSVGVSLTRQPISRDYGDSNSGTQLIISGGRENYSWSSETIYDINYSITQLNTPNPNPNKIRPAFVVNFSCPQLGELPQEPFHKNFTPIFSYYGLVNAEGIIEETTIEFNPPHNIPIPPETITYKNYDLKVGNAYWLKHGKPKCGSFYFHFDIWYRDKEWIEGPDSKEFFTYLESNGGISIYRDNVLILPAEWANKTDWYGLRQKQIKQAYRLSYYHMIANIEIDQLDNPQLIDKTSREGLLENRQFQDLREMVLGVVNLVEQSYIAFRDKYTSLTKGITRDPVKLNDVIKQQRKLLQNIDENYPVEQDPYSLFHQIVDNVSGRKERLINLDNSLKNLKSSLELIEEIQDLLKEKAAYGISVAVSVHEIAKITANFYSGISEMLKANVIDKVKLEDLKKTSASLQSELKRLSPLRAIRNENRIEFPISRSIKFASEVFKRKLEELNIDFSFNEKEDFIVYGRYGTMNQVLSNLFDNSVHWLQFSPSPDRKIEIKLNAKKRTMVFADNGPGISEAIRPYLFEAGYSLKVPPSGLGLYICKYYMQAMKGDIYETHNREKLKGFDNGAQFTLDFEKVPSQKEKAI
ncbi:ATP-binding protein [Candidatus Pollutiaquabacter sp.]|uniref:ATP-binding protein n=1 Tax=Candidatus Pollutiaquabacter sp. TaxID=3416354 RepID=UPI003CB5B451|nr:sensor histidine kinase [Bacteroidota bacterium]